MVNFLSAPTLESKVKPTVCAYVLWMTQSLAKPVYSKDHYQYFQQAPVSHIGHSMPSKMARVLFL